ncbi:hypothetical protein D3C87_1839250 [compost metagenome]
MVRVPEQGTDGDKHPVLPLPDHDIGDDPKAVSQPRPDLGRIEQVEDHLGALLLDAQGTDFGHRSGADAADACP